MCNWLTNISCTIIVLVLRFFNLGFLFVFRFWQGSGSKARRYALLVAVIRSMKNFYMPVVFMMGSSKLHVVCAYESSASNTEWVMYKKSRSKKRFSNVDSKIFRLANKASKKGCGNFWSKIVVIAVMFVRHLSLLLRLLLLKRAWSNWDDRIKPSIKWTFQGL